MKIVLDTNIYISSFFWNGNPRKVFDRIINGVDELFITDDILNEIRNVMSREKYSINRNELDDYINIIEQFSQKIFHDNILEKISRDKDDDKILKCGLESKADFIITGDKDLLVLKEYKNIRIFNPREYLKIV